MSWIALRSLFSAAIFLIATARMAPAATPAKPRAKPAHKSEQTTARKAVSRNGPVELCAINGKETLFLRLRDDKGRPLRGVQKRFDHFLRCHHTNMQHAMNPRLVRLLYQVGRHYPGLRVEVVSGYRHPSVAKNPRSPHMQGLACDFRIAGVRNQDLRDYVRRTFDKVGVGYYPNSSFVHLDVRKDRSAFWIDYSGPGGRPIYSDSPVADLKTGRADSYKPTTIAEDWVAGADQEGQPGAKPAARGAEARLGQSSATPAEEGGDDDGPPSVPAGTPAAASPAKPSAPVLVNVPAVGSVARE